MFIKLNFFFGLMLVVYGCAHISTHEELSNQTGYQLVVSEKDVSDYFEIIDVVPLQTSLQCLIGDINGIIFKNGLIYVMDGVQNQIFIFDESGRNVGKLEAIGKGPNEYIKLADIDVHNGNIYISDIDQGKFLSFDSNYSTRFEKKSFGYISSFCMLDENRFVYFSGNQPLNDTKVSENQFDNLIFRTFEKVEKSFLPFDISHEGRLYRGGSSNSTFSQKGDSLYYINSSSLIAYKVHQQGSLSEYLKINAHGSKFNEATMQLEEYVTKVYKPDNPRLLNTLNVGNEYIYYQFFINDRSYRSLYLKKQQENKVFEWKQIDKRFGVQLYALQYKGEDKGFVCYIDPSIEKSRENNKRPNIIKKYLENASEKDNPILLFMKYKDSNNESKN